MTTRSRTVLLLLLSGIPVLGAIAAAKEPVGSARKTPFHIEVKDGTGARIAPVNDSTAKPKAHGSALVFDREYQPGDRILFAGPQRMAVQLDAVMPECLLYIPDSSQTPAAYEIPYGREEKQTGSAYSPESFVGKSHRVSVRTLTRGERKAYRNLALNPCDAQQPESAPTQIFPHATTNSYSRNLFDFAARNAIDGVSQNGHHGVWPYQSWGPGLRSDLWWKLDFGRPVQLDKIRLMVRADFPHDSHWKTADVEFSDGTHLAIQLVASPSFQDVTFPKRNVTWLRIANLVPADETRWCSFIEIEAWGRDLP
jgi:hypothetical protein